MKFRKLGIRTKLVIALCSWFVVGFALLVLTVEVSKLFLVLLFLFMAFIGFYCMFLKCPNCGKCATQNPVKILGVELYVFMPWIPERCSKCGTELK